MGKRQRKRVVVTEEEGGSSAAADRQQQEAPPSQRPRSEPEALPPRPRLVRQLSGATGVRMLSPRDPSPKASPSPKAGGPTGAGAPDGAAGGAAAFLAQHSMHIEPPSAVGAMAAAADTFEAAVALYGKAPVAAIREHVASPRPTAIQAVCWALASPTIARPRPCDLIAVAETGAGKTFAFLLPAVARMQRSAAVRELWPRRDQAGPSMLVLAPTRELAQQIHSQLGLLLAAVGGPELRSACILGGQTVGENPELLGQLFRGVEAVVATPGRLLNLLDKKKTHLRRLGQLLPSDATGGSDGGTPDECGGGVLIIDEADRMLGMGFQGPIRRIMAHAPAGDTGRQTLLFSATWTDDVEAFGAELVHNPVRVTAASTPAAAAAATAAGEIRHISTVPAAAGAAHRHPTLSVNQQVSQKVIMIMSTEQDPGGEAQRLDRIVELLREAGHGRDERGRKRKGGAERKKVLVFTSTKVRCENLSRALQACSIAALRIHGDRPQAQRDSTLATFLKAGKGSVLVATDVAARGLHIDDIDLVVNYDFPLAKGDTGVEQYVHRVGRTGRAGKQGRAVSFFEPSVDGDNARALIEMIASGSDGSSEPPPELVALVEAKQQKRHKAQ
jgi:ATP-dependent RNA helicase DDX5/DBP2